MSVNYSFVLNGVRRDLRNAACFADMWHKKPELVTYSAEYDQLSNDDIERFIAFVYIMLGGDRISHEVQGKVVHWTLRSDGLNFGKMLVYLGTFRIPDESPKTFDAWKELVDKGKLDKPDELFEAMQKALVGGTFHNTNHNILAPPTKDRGWRSYEPEWQGVITLAQLKDNLENKEKTTCFSHFIHP